MIDRIEELKEENEIQELIQLLDEGDLREREDAAKVLGLIGSEDALPTLVERVKNDPASTVRANAALALSNFETEECERPLKIAADDEDWEVRHDAAIAMGDLTDERFEETLCSLIEDQDKEVRKKAIESIGKIAKADKISEIENFLEDESLKITAARAISEIDTEKAIEPLKKIYYDGDQRMREIAVRGLGEIGSEETMTVLLDSLKDESWRIREEAAKILGKIGEEDYIDPLLERLEDTSSYVVGAALRSLGYIGEDRVLQHIRENMFRDEPGVRIAAAEALGNLDTSESAEMLIELLKDEKNPRVLWSISDSISGLSKEILKDVKGDIESIPEDKKIFISVSMVKAGFSSYAEAIIDALDSERWKIRQKAAEALENVDTEELNKRLTKRLFTALRNRLDDNDKWVRARSIRTLATLIDQSEDDLDDERIKEDILEIERTEVDKDVLEAVREAKQLLNQI